MSKLQHYTITTWGHEVGNWQLLMWRSLKWGTQRQSQESHWPQMWQIQVLGLSLLAGFRPQSSICQLWIAAVHGKSFLLSNSFLTFDWLNCAKNQQMDGLMLPLLNRHHVWIYCSQIVGAWQGYTAGLPPPDTPSPSPSSVPASDSLVGPRDPRAVDTPDNIYLSTLTR